MALSAKTLASRNPLRIAGTAMPENALLMAKLLVVALVATNQVRYLPDPFLPFIPGLDRLMPGALFQGILQAVFLISAVALFFNCAVRASSLILGSTILLAVLSSRAYFSNNMTFCALLLILAGLSARGSQTYLLRVQVAIVYFGAGLNKALDADWHSGQFFDHWAIDALHNPVYIWLHALLPPLMLGKLASWTTIGAELGLAIALLIPGLRFYAVATSIVMQGGFCMFTGEVFGVFFFAMQAAALSFLDWPSKPLDVIYDGTCGFCDWCREQFARLDFDKLFAWVPYQSGRGHAYGITDEAASIRLQLVTPGGRVLDGFQAVRRMLVLTPAVWMVLFALIGIGRGRRVLVAGTLLFLSPLVNWVGMATYDLVARNRHRIFPGRPCALRVPSSGPQPKLTPSSDEVSRPVSSPSTIA